MFLSRKKFNELSSQVDAIATHIGISDAQLAAENDKDLLKNRELRLKAAYALNLCTVSVSQIIDYNDIYILEQEYDAILNNLNIQRFIKDEALLKILKQILDTITFFRIQEGDKKFIEKEYQQKMRSAVWSAVPNLSVIFAGGNPLTMAIAAATQIGIGYMNYRKNKNQYLLEKERQEWELHRSAIEQFNGLRRELFETAWRLSERFDFPDEYRLTEKQIMQYDTILLDTDPLRRYERLDVISHIFEAFPPYWYYKGNAAREIAVEYKNSNPEITQEYYEKALKDYEKFDEIYQEDMELMREDVIAASCFLEHITLLTKSDNNNTKKIADLLERAVRLAGDNFDVLQQCVFHYLFLAIYDISYNGKMVNILRRLVNEEYNIALNGQMLSRVYCKILKDRPSYDILSDRIGLENVMPWVDNDDEAQAGYLGTSYESLCERFNYFLDRYYDKYEITFNRLIQFKIIDQADPDSIYTYEKKHIRTNYIKEICQDRDLCPEFLSGLNIVSEFVSLSNELFNNLYQSALFDIINNDNNPWKNIFEEIAKKMKEDINKIKNLHDKLKKGAFDPQESLIKLVSLVEFNDYTKIFFEKLSTEFREHLTEDLLSKKQPEIDGALDKLSFDNNILLNNIKAVEKTDSANRFSDDFFFLPGYEDDPKMTADGIFPIFTGGDTRLKDKIRRCIEEKIKNSIRKQDRIYFPSKWDRAKFANEVNKIDKNTPIRKESIIAIIDTSFFNNLDKGIWLSYDGIYFREWETKYVEYTSIDELKIKKSTDIQSPLIIQTNRGGQKIEYKDNNVYKDRFIGIIQNIKKLIEGNQ